MEVLNLSCLSYHNIDVENIRIALNLSTVDIIDVDNIDAMLEEYTIICINSTNVYIIFRGTDSIRDCITDLNVTRTNTPYGEIHSGFLNVYDTIHNNIKNKIIELNKDNTIKTITFSGHSMGGALATIASIMIDIDEIIIYCITFGSPRVGDIKFSQLHHDKLKNNSIRYVHSGDLIPHLPIKLRFKHVKNKIYVDSTTILSRIINRIISHKFPHEINSYRDEYIKKYKYNLKI